MPVRPLRGGAVGQGLHDLLADLGCVDAQGDKHLRCHTPVPVDQAKQEMFSADVVVVQLAGLVCCPAETVNASGVNGIWPFTTDDLGRPMTSTAWRAADSVTENDSRTWAARP